ncbi:MAG TPA: hypothetical protein PKN75_10750 [Bacteroidia bacterium]|nr:hypothetical protein [Bacteroidia bacterium]HNU34057.1 hypothetical protein [Bacteroidia bacterium]
MSKRAFLILSFFFSLCVLKLEAQDTLIVYNNFKYKFGAKFLVDRSNDYSLTPDGSTVCSGGFQIVRRFGKSKSFLESGIYLMSKSLGTSSDYWRIVYRNISVPFNYRFDTKVVYFAGGIYFDYLIKKEYQYEATPKSEMQDRKFNLGYTLAMGIEKQITKELNLLIEVHTINNLTYSYTNRGDLFSPSYSNNGFSLGINYKLLR